MVYLTQHDLDRLVAVMSKFPSVERFELCSDTSSGIGTVVTVRFPREVAGVTGTFEVEISGVEDW